MNIEEFRTFCLSKKGVTESFPFDEDILVFKVLHKIFALTALSSEDFSVNLKCKPERSILLRESYDSIIPGFHMNKKHWNTIKVSQLSDKPLFIELINHSYDLVVKGLTKKDQLLLKAL